MVLGGSIGCFNNIIPYIDVSIQLTSMYKNKVSSRAWPKFAWHALWYATDSQISPMKILKAVVSIYGEIQELK